jgi:thymidylate synthase
MEIARKNALDSWKESLKAILDNGEKIGTKDSPSIEILNMTITIEEPLGAAEPMEVLRSIKKWTYPEIEEIEDVIFRKEAASIYHYTYGARIFNYASQKNQVDDYIIPLLKENPTSRRAIAVLYNPLVDSKAANKESPGIVSIHFKVSGTRLCATAVIRSNDMLIGWPANIYQASILQRHVAEKLGVSPGSLTTISHSAHITLEHEEEARKVVAMR